MSRPRRAPPVRCRREPRLTARHVLMNDGLPGKDLRGTIVAMTTDSLRNVKDRFSEFVDRVDREHERIVVTRNGRPAAVLISPDDLDSLEETLELLGDHDAIRELVEAQAAVAAGDAVRGVDAVRALRPPRTA
jgi:antitoxin YefM